MTTECTYFPFDYTGMDTSPSGVNWGQSYASTRLVPALPVATGYAASDGDILMPGCQSSSLPHNQTHETALYSWPAHMQCGAFQKHLGILYVHRLTAQQGVYCFQLNEQALHSTTALTFICQILLHSKGSCARGSRLLLPKQFIGLQQLGTGTQAWQQKGSQLQ